MSNWDLHGARVSRKPGPRPQVSIAWSVADGDTLFFCLDTRFPAYQAVNYYITSREMRRQIRSTLESLPESHRALTCLTRRHTLIDHDRHRMNGLTSSFVLLTAAYMGFARGEDDQPLKEALQQLSNLATILFMFPIREAEMASERFMIQRLCCSTTPDS